jgi:Transposase DDE domain
MRWSATRARRWVVERCFAWSIRNHRLAKDYERKVQTSETLIELAAIRLLLRRLAMPREVKYMAWRSGEVSLLSHSREEAQG